MKSTIKNEISLKAGEKIQSLRRGGFKTVFYVVVLIVSLVILDFVFGKPVEDVPPFLEPLIGIIILVQPYLIYIQAVLVFAMGYLVVNATSGLVYTYMRRVTDHATAATLRTITKISGVAVLLSLTASVFKVDATAALTVGSFGGLVAGFATQTILSHVVAGVFLLLMRPFTYGDMVTVAGQTGIVKEIKLMHLVLETEDGTKEILIPSGTVVTQVIHKMKPPKSVKPIKTTLTLDALPKSILKGSTVTFTGKLVESQTENPVGGKDIKILERDVGGDDLLAKAVTASDGAFVATWVAKKTDRYDNTAEIYAKFEGDDGYQQAASKQYIVTIEGN